jgi:hypothetical protein
MKKLVDKKADEKPIEDSTADTKEYWDMEDRLYEQYKELRMEGRLEEFEKGD